MSTGAIDPFASTSDSNRSGRPHAIVIDGDPVAQAVLVSFLRALEWDVEPAADGVQGLELIRARPRSVVFVDWVIQGMSGLDLCARIRDSVWSERPYVIITTGKEPRDLWRALAAGADDVLRKPLERREVATRVALARFFTEGSARLSMTEAVIEAMSAPAGELVVRQGEELGRVMFRDGHIVWVTVTPTRTRFADHLVRELGVDESDIRAVLEESKVTGLPFDQIMVDWQIAGSEALRACRRAWLENNLERIRQLKSPAVLFAPLPPGGATFDGFAVDDLAPWMIQRQSAPDSEAPLSASYGSIGRRVIRAMSIEGAIAAFALVVRDGACLAQKGAHAHIEVSWALARALHSMPPSASRGADIVLSSSDCHYVARSLENDPDVLMVVVLDAHVATVGKARVHVALAASSSAVL